MIVLEGQPALSPFRRERLESRLRALSPDARVAGAWHVYWVEPADAGQAIDSAFLHRLLQARAAVAPRDSAAVSRSLAPRMAPISPWASTASELLRSAGLAGTRAPKRDA